MDKNNFRGALSALAFLLVLGACATDEVATTMPAPTASAPVLRVAYREPGDFSPVERFDDPEIVKLWASHLQFLIGMLPINDTPFYGRMLEHFTIDKDSLVGDGSVPGLYPEFQWTYTSTPVVDAEPTWSYLREGLDHEITLEEARFEEANDNELIAGEMFAQLGDVEGVRRCATALREEGEWKAVAMLGVHLPTNELLDEGLGVLVRDDQITRAQDVLRYAAGFQKFDKVAHLAEQHHWQIGTLFSLDEVRRLASAGYTEPIRQILAAQIENLSGRLGPDHWHASETVSPIVMGILELAPRDKSAALELAQRLVKLEGITMLAKSDPGEGCYVQVVSGTVQLYELFKDDAEFRRGYLEVFRDLNADDSYMSLPGCGLAEEQVLALVRLVRDVNDKALTEKVRGLLNGWARAYPYALQVAALMFGGQPDLEWPGLTDTDRYLLSRASGKQSAVPEYLDAARLAPVLRRSAVEDLKYFWLRLRLDRGQDAPTFAAGEFVKAIDNAERLYDEQPALAEQIWAGLVRSGYEGPYVIHGAAAEPVTDSLRYELAQRNLGSEGQFAQARIVQAWIEQYVAASEKVAAAQREMLEELAAPYAAVEKNRAIGCLPSSWEQADHLVMPNLEHLAVRDYDQYLEAITVLAKYRSHWYDDEVGRLTRSGDAALLNKLLTMRSPQPQQFYNGG